MKIKEKMPQLIPLYYVNEVSYLYIVYLILLIVIMKVILPYFPRLGIIIKTLIEAKR